MKETSEHSKEKQGKNFDKNEVIPFCFSVVVLTIMVFTYLAHDAWDFSISGQWINVLIGFGLVLIFFVFIYLLLKMRSGRKAKDKPKHRIQS